MSKLETNTIDNVSGSTTLTIGDSNASTISIPKNITLGASGTTITVPAGATITNNGTQTGFGGTNTPAFFAHKTSSQTINDVTTTKVTWNTTVFDTHSAFASDKFTVPSGQGGKYLFTNFMHVYDANEVIAGIHRSYRKNGSQVSSIDIANTGGNMAVKNSASSIILDLSAGDYIESYIWANTTDNGTFVVYGEVEYYTYFYGYKIIE